MTIAIRVFGVQDTIRAFGEIPRAVGNLNMRKAMNAGGGVIRDAAVSRVPISSGLLRKSLIVKVRVPLASFNPKHHGRPAYAVIGPAYRVTGRVANVRGRFKTLTVRQSIRRAFGGGGFSVRSPWRYAHLIERGTKGHKITATNKRVLASGGVVFGRKVKHPGTKAYGFLSGAVASSGEAAKAKVVQKLKDGLSEWSAKRATRIRIPGRAFSLSQV